MPNAQADPNIFGVDRVTRNPKKEVNCGSESRGQVVFRAVVVTAKDIKGHTRVELLGPIGQLSLATNQRSAIGNVSRSGRPPFGQVSVG